MHILFIFIREYIDIKKLKHYVPLYKNIASCIKCYTVPKYLVIAVYVRYKDAIYVNSVLHSVP